MFAILVAFHVFSAALAQPFSESELSSFSLLQVKVKSVDAAVPTLDEILEHVKRNYAFIPPQNLLEAFQSDSALGTAFQTVNKTMQETAEQKIRAEATGFAAFQTVAFEDREDCPTTYLYDIPELWDFHAPMSRLVQDGWERFGGEEWARPCVNQGIMNIQQYTMPLMVVYRLLTSKRCPLTSNPDKADIFVVPFLPRPKRDVEFCDGNVGGVDPTPYLKHLNARTAHKHVFLVGKGHMALATCNKWWVHPTNLLRRSIRVTFSMPAAGYPGPDDSIEMGYGPLDGPNVTFETLAGLMGRFDSDDEDFPHTYSVPYPSTTLLDTSEEHEPWKDFQSKRSLLAYYIGREHGLYGVEVRHRIGEECSRVGPPTCLNVEISDRCMDFDRKRDAYFCLEPGGDTPNRKSIWDSISFGCVPVLFSPHQQILAPWHWGHFQNSSTVYINREDFLAGRIDLFKTLEEIQSSGKLDELRRNIAKHSHATHFSLTDRKGDAVERILHGAKNHAVRYELAHQL